MYYEEERKILKTILNERQYEIFNFLVEKAINRPENEFNDYFTCTLEELQSKMNNLKKISIYNTIKSLIDLGFIDKKRHIGNYYKIYFSYIDRLIQKKLSNNG